MLLIMKILHYKPGSQFRLLEKVSIHGTQIKHLLYIHKSCLESQCIDGTNTILGNAILDSDHKSQINRSVKVLFYRD